MTLRVRNRLISVSAAAVLAVSVLLSLLVGFEIWTRGGIGPLVNGLPDLHEAGSLYGIPVPFTGTSYGYLLLSILVPVPVAVGAAVLTRRYFRTSITPTIFFVTVSMILSGMTSLRMAQFLLPRYGFTFTHMATLSRAVYAIHIAGALSLFTASIYAAGAQYTRIWGAFIAVGAVALSFAYVLPVDTFQLDEALLHRLASSGNVQLVTGVLALLTLVNFLRYGIEAEDSGRAAVPLAVGAMLLAREVLFYVSGLPLHLAVAIVYTVGFVLFVRNSYAVYLWT